jgi:hypothetical protein
VAPDSLHRKTTTAQYSGMIAAHTVDYRGLEEGGTTVAVAQAGYKLTRKNAIIGSNSAALMATATSFTNKYGS